MNYREQGQCSNQRIFFASAAISRGLARTWNYLKHESVSSTILLLAIFLRVAHVKAVFYSPVGDMRTYLNLASDLVAPGGGANPLWTCFFPPGYPFWLILCGKIFCLTTLKGILYLQALISGAAVVPLIRATRNLFSPQAALVTGFIYAVYMPYIYSSALLLSEAIAVTLLILFLWLLSETLRSDSYRWVIAGAVILAAAVHVRTNLSPLVLPAAAVIFLGPKGVALCSVKRRALFGLVFVSVFLGLLVPWSLRNTVLTGQVMFLAANSGMNFYQGNNPITAGGWPDFDSAVAFYQEFSPNTPNPVDRDRQYAALGWKFVREYPVYEAFYLLPQRIRHLFADTQKHFWPWYMDSPGGVADYPFGPLLYFVLLDYPVVYILAFAGLVFSPHRNGFFLALLWLAILGPLLSVHGNIRFRFPMDVFVMPLAGQAVSLLLSHTQRMTFGRFLLGYTFLFAFGSALYFLRFAGPDRLREPTVSEPLSETAEELLQSPVVIGKGVVPLYDVRTQPGLIPHYWLSYVYRVEPARSEEFLGPNVRFDFYDERGTTITLPVRSGTVLSSRHRLNQYQETTGTAWHVITVPALAKRLRLTLENDVDGRVTVGHLKLRGPIWCPDIE